MTIRFAHIADCHLGAFRDPVLRRLNLEAFLKALLVAEERRVDFVVVAGDMFDSPLPDMTVVQGATEALWRLRSTGSRVYVFRGSHDRSVTESGIVEVLAATHLFDLVDLPGEGGEAVGPALVRDGPTGAVLCAVGGMRGGLENEAMRRLDPRGLGDAVVEAPLAIFGFHGSVEGMLPEELRMLDAVPRQRLPAGFDYIALGHVHHHEEAALPGGTVAAYPGPTFGATFTDLADRRPKGMLVVEAGDGGKCRTEFVPLETATVALLDLDAEGRDAVALHDELLGAVEDGGWEGSIVLLRVRGTLGQGRPAEIGIGDARDGLLDRGALSVHVSRSGLKGADGGARPGGGGGVAGGSTDPVEVSRMVLARRLEGYETPHPGLRGADGQALAWELVEVLKRERGGQKVADHREAVVEQAMALLGLPDPEGGDGP